MRTFIIALSIMVLGFSCNRNSNCVTVMITRQGTDCSTWGINANGQIYASNDIPANFQQEGLLVCVDYEPYEDMRVCPCCGGIWAKIKSIRLPD